MVADDGSSWIFQQNIYLSVTMLAMANTLLLRGISAGVIRVPAAYPVVGTSQQKRRPSGNEISSACRRRRLSGTHISKIRRPARRVAFLPISLIAFDQSRTNFPDSIPSPLTSAIKKSISSIGTLWLVESKNSGAYSRRQDCGSYSRISRC